MSRRVAAPQLPLLLSEPPICVLYRSLLYTEGFCEPCEQINGTPGVLWEPQIDSPSNKDRRRAAVGLASEVGGAVLWGSDLTLWGLLLSPGRQGQGGVNLWDTQPVPQRTAWWGKHPDIR